MNCESCGSFIPDGQSFCSNCGAKAPVIIEPARPIYQQNDSGKDYSESVEIPMPKKYNVNYIARAGLILGIVSVVAVYIPYTNIVPAILSIIFSLVGLKKVDERGGRGNCIAGFILSGIGIVLFILTVIFAIIRETKG